MALNASAPTFIPTFGIQDAAFNNNKNTTHESTSTFSPLSSSSTFETTTNRNQRQTSKGTKQQRSRNHRRNKNNHGNGRKPNKSQQDHQGQQETKKNENKTKESSQSRKKNHSQQSQNDNNKKNNNNNRQRQRRRRRRNNRNKDEQQERNTAYRYGSLDQTVALHEEEEESAFPPLLLQEAATPQVDGRTLEQNTNHDHWSSIAWNGHQTSLIEEEKMETERQQQIFSQSTLSMTMLTNHATTTADTNNTHRLDVWKKNTSRLLVSNQRQETENSEKLASVEPVRGAALATTTAPITSRKRFDMGKLRGRWWNLLKSQRQKEEALEVKIRQGEKHKESIVMDDDDGQSVSSSSSSSSSCSSSSLYSSSSSSSSSDYDTNSYSSDGQQYTNESTKFDNYLSSEYPLHQAILEEDLTSIASLLSMNDPRRIRANAFASRKALGLVETEQDDHGATTKLYSVGAAFSPLQLAVYLDRPHLIKPLLGMPLSSTSSQLPSPTVADNRNRTPLMLAAELGLDGCIKLLLLHQHDVTLTTKDNQNGNTALHYACRAGAPASTLRLVLLGEGGNNKKNAIQQQRILLPLKNHRGQTPLHVACEHGHVHLVEVFLSTCSASLLSKVLRMQDNLHQTPLLAAIGAGSIDTVMSILMWRGNHHQPPQQTTQVKTSSTTTTTTPCPLTWAICKGNIEMIHLLLEFNHPVTPYKSDGSYYLVDALYMAVNLNDVADVENSTATNSDSSGKNAFGTVSSTKLEIIQILVNAGANPCSKMERHDPNVVPCMGGGGGGTLSNAESAAETTPVSAAAAKGDVRSIKVMLDMFQRVKEQNTVARRQDPKLQKQPETYFEAIEAREQHEIDTALCDALVKSLFTSWKTDDFTLQKQCLQVAIALLHRGAKLNQAGFARLKDSIAFNRLKSPMEQFTMTEGLYRFETTYYHYSEPTTLGSISKKLSTFDRSALNFWSKRLCAMSWMKHCDLHLQCSWMKGELLAPKNHLSEDSSSSLTSLGDVILLAEEECFRVHSEIISAKSAKLAAAVRFEMMNQESDNEDPNDRPPIELKIDLSSRMCKYLLQHIYHGSIFCGWPLTSMKGGICGEILEMALVAEEYLIPSLKHECEMRLLSAHPKRCYCWSCCTVVQSCCGVVMDPQSMPVYECLYRINGPSRLLDETSVLDALAVSQQLQEFKSEKGLKFWSLLNIPVNSVFSDKTVWENYRKNQNCLSVDFEGVKHAAIEVFFNSFCAVIQSPSYSLQMQSTFDEEPNDAGYQSRDQENEMQTMLLQACLDELSESTMVCTNNSIYSKAQQSSRINEAVTKS